MAETGSWSQYFITKAGRELRQQWIAEGKKPVFTRAAIGTGKPSDESVIDTMTGLVSFERDIIIKKSYAVEANHLCIVRVDNSGYTQDVFMTEVAIFAKLPEQPDSMEIHYGYTYIIDGYVRIPAQDGNNNLKIYELTLDTYLSRATQIEIVFDASSVYVSHQDLDDALANYGAEHYIATVYHGLGYNPICELYATKYAAGVQDAGDGPGGGEDPISIPARFGIPDSNTVSIYAQERWVGSPEVNQISPNEFSLVYPNSIDSLYLIVR